MRQELTLMTKIEVVVGREDEQLVHGIFKAAGTTGFTSVSNVSGSGHAGYHEGRLPFNDRDGLLLTFTVVRADRADALIDALRTLFDRRPGVMFVTDTYVSRPSYFEEGPTP